MALIGDEDSRPGLIGYEERNKPLYSEVEEETSDRITREFEQKKRETVLDLTMNQIIENTVNMIGNFSKDYIYRLHDVNLEFELYGEEEGFYVNLKKYLVAFMLYLGSNDNLLYFGIILVVLSIILYFFNISSK